jgi:transcriptional regulator of acetoin/glycerol metabolism
MDDRLGRARMMLEGRGQVVPSLVAPEIAASWQRCLDAGLDPAQPPPGGDGGVLRLACERHEPVLRLAMAEMQGLYRQIAGTNFMIAFAAPDGTLLKAIADPSFRAAAAGAAIQPGTLWTERRRGTNALGTVAETGCPVMVHGPEHFFRVHAGLTCVAAPVFGSDARLAGVLDASSDCRTRQRHTRALVAMAASQVENGLFRAHHAGDVVIAFHSRGEYLHTLSAGLIAFDPAGRVRGTNTQARFLLQGLPARPGRGFGELFETPWSRVLDGSGPLDLRDRAGSTYAAASEAPRPRPRAPAAAPAATPSPGFVAPGFVAPGFVAPGFVANDPAVLRTVRVVEAAVRRGVPVLIRGATGTGKEELARHAHAASGRRGAFVPVNCAAITESLAEAELFGHAPGAYTGAQRGGAPGLAVEAHEGTLFLDEIGDMKPSLQALLLRLLDDWTVRPVGGGRTRTLDVLLLAATNTDLGRAVAEGRFRADLYWRLNVVEAVLPPLVARSDLDAIVDHLLARAAPGLALPAETRAWIARQPWPGNMRELRSTLVRIALAGPDSAFPAHKQNPAPSRAGQPDSPLRDTIQTRIRGVHGAMGGNVARTARALGISRNTVYRALR